MTTTYAIPFEHPDAEKLPEPAGTTDEHDAAVPPMTTAEARELADELIRDLSPCLGSPEQVSEVMGGWHDDLTLHEFYAVSVAALARVFGTCLNEANGTPDGGPVAWPTETAGVAP